MITSMQKEIQKNSQDNKVHVSDTENSEEASFYESYEAAHMSHSLSGSIAKVPLSLILKGAVSQGDGVIYLRFPNKGYREKIRDHAAGYIVVGRSFASATFLVDISIDAKNDIHEWRIGVGFILGWPSLSGNTILG
ncbi:SAL1 phosphatase [Tanacetum coccineum]